MDLETGGSIHTLYLTARELFCIYPCAMLAYTLGGWVSLRASRPGLILHEHPQQELIARWWLDSGTGSHLRKGGAIMCGFVERESLLCRTRFGHATAWKAPTGPVTNPAHRNIARRSIAMLSLAMVAEEGLQHVFQEGKKGFRKEVYALL